MKALDDVHFFCSWSGGKDSCLALYRAMKQGGVPRFLLTTMHEAGDRSRGHGVPLGVIEAQADSLDLPLRVRSTSWENYEKNFSSELRGIKDRGVTAGVFGDIDVEDHREWVERVCADQGMEAFLPLWGGSRDSLLDEFLGAGFSAVIVAVREGLLGREYLGRVLGPDLVNELREEGVDVSGENGEYHTLVTDGPLFSRPVNLSHGGHIKRDGVWTLDLSLA
jgi:uncharacterized protein (TIGR00290 family)